MHKLSIQHKQFREIGAEATGTETLDVVIVNASPIARSYYNIAYDLERTNTPYCWSTDTVAPAQDVPEDQKQAARCLDCAKNIKGTGDNGTRACKYFQYLAVVKPDDFDTVYRLKLPANSIFGGSGKKMPLQQYARFLTEHKTSAITVVTRLYFNDDSDVPQVLFKPVRVVADDELQTLSALVEHPDTLAVVKVDDFTQPVSVQSPFSVEDSFDAIQTS